VNSVTWLTLTLLAVCRYTPAPSGYLGRVNSKAFALVTKRISWGNHMRLLLILGVIAVIGLVVTGAITLQRSDDNKITIQIDKGKVKEEAETVMEKGKEVLQGAGSALREASRDRQTK
jgi:hypothetical protein